VPARVVGGDFFDFFRYQQSGKFVGLLADVSGKGAAAALYAALTSGIVGSLVEDELSSQQMLRRLNRSLYLRAPEEHFVALTYSTRDDELLLLETCSSGLPEPLLCRNGSIQRLPLHGVPLGLMPETDYETMHIQCEPGDTLLFYTDGVVDAMDQDGNEFGTDRLCEVVIGASQDKTDRIVDIVFDQVAAHCRSKVAFDDQTVVAMRVL
jgi:sigma-B regulation protein RsbU (phosphoserine phosphatase)